MSLDKASLLALFAPQVIPQTVDGVGEVRLRELSAPEVSDIRDACQAKDTKADFGFRLVIASVVNEDGQPIFNLSDLPDLRSKAQVRIGNLIEAVMKVNGFTVREDAAKN
jgi:hypothetical protein